MSTISYTSRKTPRSFFNSDTTFELGLLCLWAVVGIVLSALIGVSPILG